MDYKNFGLYILVHRKRNRVTQTDFANRAEISRNYLSIIERGLASNMSIDVLVKLAGAMSVAPCELLEQLAGNHAGEGRG